MGGSVGNVQCCYLIWASKSRSTKRLYSSKPPSMLLTQPFPQTHSSLHTTRIRRSSCDTRITPPWKRKKNCILNKIQMVKCQQVHKHSVKPPWHKTQMLQVYGSFLSHSLQMLNRNVHILCLKILHYPTFCEDTFFCKWQNKKFNVAVTILLHTQIMYHCAVFPVNSVRPWNRLGYLQSVLTNPMVKSIYIHICLRQMNFRFVSNRVMLYCHCFSTLL